MQNETFFGFSKVFRGQAASVRPEYGNIVINPQMKYKASNAGRVGASVSLKMKRVKHK
ncbi:TPA: hypothetical protein ACFNZI_001489 [Neisseria meningitidis]|uniref:hypothetical protein n=1 Tax=Neisseria polysaccharea TaxID=489 RepID=UPI0013B3AD03